MNWKLHISRHPVGYASLLSGVAVLVFALACVAALGTATFLTHRERHQAGVEYAQRIATHISDFLRALNRNEPPHCNPDQLTRLRKLGFASEFVKDIGVFDEEGRLACTTVTGVLTRPVSSIEPDFVRALPDLEFEYFFNRPLLVTDRTTTATIVRAGRFNVVIDPSAMGRLDSYGFDIIRVVKLENGFHNHFIMSRRDDLSKDAARLLGTPTLWNSETSGFSLEVPGYYQSTPLSHSAYVLQRFTPLGEVIQVDPSTLIGLCTLAVLFGLLTYGASRPWLAQQGSMEQRIGGLLRDANIVCVYQPIVDLRTGALHGCEVLLRLREGGQLMSPDSFLPAVVARGLTWPLDRAVIRTSLRELAQALPQDAELKVSLNLFPENVRARRLLDTVAEVRAQHPHAGLKINIEVIEHDYRDDIAVEIEQLKAQGYVVSVDDFGTGYSNLGSIRKIAPHYLKIDRSFVHDMQDATLRSSLIPEIAAIAKATGAQVIAEGVENEAQRSALERMGIGFGQGYLFARPMPLAEFMAYMSEQAALGPRAPWRHSRTPPVPTWHDSLMGALDSRPPA